MSTRSGIKYLKDYGLRNEADPPQHLDVDTEHLGHADHPEEADQPDNADHPDNVDHLDDAEHPDIADQPSSVLQLPPPPPSDTKSKTTKTSRTSSSRSSARKAYARALAAKAQLVFAEKEASMMKQKADLEASMMKQKADVEKQKADLDASLHILKCQKEVAAAEAEAAAYEELQSQSGEGSIKPLSEVDSLMKVQRTSEYVAEQRKLVLSQTSNRSHQFHENTENTKAQDINQFFGQLTTDTQYAPPPTSAGVKQEQKATKGSANTQILNPLALAFQPPNNNSAEFNVAQDFAKYLIRKELVSAGLLHFDDKPENYWAWKASFVSATKDLNLSAREEVDLLTKWLGPKSSEQAKRIRAVHTLNPSAGVKMVW